MLVTLVIRLVPERLAVGEFVGEVEHVGDGTHEVVHTVSELVEFAQHAAATETEHQLGDGRGTSAR